ncbi:hypothetical protein K7432_010220 [Basidiobolus ranarum]|uniref:Saposin B-type domain-containing protein n=1 Tax=Basidiobolus ranarum TaxID=34480 RepID=A0ABR2VVV7_9FUNG
MRFSLPLIVSISALFLSSNVSGALSINSGKSPIKAGITGNSPDCVICEFVMTQIDEMLKNGATKEEIQQAVHGVCNYLPQSVTKQCNNFVYKYADSIVQLLINGTDPLAVCPALSVCSSK